MAKLQLTSPWIKYYYELKAMFKMDPDIHVIFDEEETAIQIYVEGTQKAEALHELLPESREFGNVTLNIAVILSNDESKRDRYRPRYTSRYCTSQSETELLFVNAFSGNAAFMFSETVSGILSNDIIYVVFRNEVVQYYNDDLGDYFGHCSTLYQNIAADIFKPIDGVHYCTDKPRYDRCED